ncbi:translation elongation factor Ts [Desulfovibrio mangrovi]|uniref:translation elongation factor Ts n=1 Tax=Desulfovibrio mangrovi TaxID=2976983 RepID=UPI002247525C|nr:translation elongation factor Ts [Desulfovibrio mangrovi]UZP67310.1 translation elongation factor Ts [Desulfovibrio mangrovi]
MSISAAMVKSLRDKTGAGMMDCKKALAENNGDEEKAIDWLRQKGLSKAAKKAGRATTEGLVGCVVEGKVGALAEFKCETDFVARNEAFIALSQKFAQDVAANGAEGFTDRVAADVTDCIATLGENMSAGRAARVTLANDGVIGSYVHSNGKIGVLVAIEGTDNAELAKNIAMQVAATNPVSLDASSIPADLIEREREIHRQKTLEEGKPENIVDKIVDGRMQKFFKEVTLLDQPYIRDDKMAVKDLLKGGAKVTEFVRFALGEDAVAEEEEAE